MNTLFSTARAALVGIALCVLPTTSHALTATSNIGDVAGIWSGAHTKGGKASINGNGNQISWGKTRNGSRQSAYNFGQIGKSGPFDLGQTFKVGRFTHNNFTIYGNALTSAKLAVTIGGQLFDGVSNVNFSLTSYFDVIHHETRNKQKSCPYGDRPPCGDLITFVTNRSLSETIKLNGIEYLFEITGFIGGFRNGNALFSDENRKNSAIMQGKFTAVTQPPAPVPVPAALPMLAGALALTGWVVRRRKS